MQARYQYGRLDIRERKKGPNVWQFRWIENGKPKSMLIGTVEKLPTELDAQRAVEYLRIKINAANPQQQFHAITVGALIDRFMAEYVPKWCRPNTQRNYQNLFKNHVRPRWGADLVANVKTMAVEDWLESHPGSRQVKSHVRNLMHTLFQSAIRWEIIERNPVDLVRQSRKRLKVPRVLTPEEFKALLGQLAEPYKAMVTTITCLGLRVSELLGLQWGDFDFDNLAVKIQRSVVEGQIYPTKTEASEGTLPLAPELAATLLAHRARTDHKADSDFVFAGETGKPRWKDCILADYIKPAALKAKIGNIGWHAFRHTYSTLLHAHGAAPAVQKELLRHANISTTLNIYTQAVSTAKREAAQNVVSLLYESVLTGNSQAGSKLLN
jgi:integrase